MASGNASSGSPTASKFCQFWPGNTNDNNLTLHGFRRYKTTHLLNLRFLEDEIAMLDHSIYQAGLSLGHEPSVRDRLGLKSSKTDSNIPDVEKILTPDLVLELRNLI